MGGKGVSGCGQKGREPTGNSNKERQRLRERETTGLPELVEGKER